MCDTRNFRKEYDVFLQRFPHRTAVIEDIKVRYQYGGKENAPVILFFNGLEMQEMWMPCCVYMLKDYPPFQANDFEYLRGRILILLPENDIFKKEDQKRFADLFRKLDAEIHNVPGGHVGFIVQAERYLDLMETFLQRNGI